MSIYVDSVFLYRYSMIILILKIGQERQMTVSQTPGTCCFCHADLHILISLNFLRSLSDVYAYSHFIDGGDWYAKRPNMSRVSKKR